MPTVSEAMAYQQSVTSTEEVDQMIKYYNSDSDILRRSLQVMLNNWSGELDRAVSSSKPTPQTDKSGDKALFMPEDDE